MTHEVSSSSKVASSNNYLGMTNTAGLDRQGFWYEYIPVNVGNTAKGASVIPYRWDSILPMPNSATEMQIEGTFALITEPWNGSNVKYHNGCIVHIGSGINDITATQEQDALFFPHLGSLSPAPDDDGFYWDRMYLAIDDTDWLFYQYHLHLPSFYPQTENNRSTISAIDYIRPDDRAYGYCIPLRVSVAGQPYQSVLLRVHTPSVGGAHNSHNDITLPQTNNKNYQMGGVIKGAGDTLHAFYISANGSQWDVFSRTYVDASASCTSEVLIGTYDLADPTFNVSPGENYNFPVRASVGDFYSGRIYFPVILNNATSGYDLEIWSFESATSLSSSSLQRTTILTGESVRPDCHLITIGDEVHAVVTKLSSNGVAFYALENGTWTLATNGVFVTNGSNPLRVHGLRYNPQDVSYYTILSGTSSGTGTYTGPGLYKFTLVGDFPGYKHLDYDYTNHAFIVKDPLTAGHLSYSTSNGYITRYSTTEPEGIATGTQILTREYGQPEFFNRKILRVPESYIYQGIKLRDNRKFLAGRIEIDEQDDLFMTLVSQDNSESVSFYYGGTANGYQGGSDYITGAFQSMSDPNKIWMTGYAKSELVERKDILIHGYVRNLKDDPNLLSNEDIVIDSSGNIFVLIQDETSVYGAIAKYDNNYNLLWQKIYYNDDFDLTVSKMAIDSDDNIYIIGSLSDDSAIIIKLDNDGGEVWSYQYTQSSGTDTGSSIAIIDTGSEEVIVAAINNSTDSSLIVLDLDGVIRGQNKISNLNVNAVRKSQSETNRVLFAGNTTSAGKFGMCQIESDIPVVKWVSEFGTQINDIANVNNSSPKGYAIVGKDSTNAIIASVNVTESGSTFTVAKDWARTLNNSSYNALVVSPYTETTKYLYAVGSATMTGVTNMGMTDCITVKYDSTGAIQWQNAFGHHMMEVFNAAVFDMYNRNILTAGWSTSHSNAKDAIFFRFEPNGFGTGTYHPPGNTSMAYYYLKSTQTESNNTNSINNLTAPASVTTALFSGSAVTITFEDGGFASTTYDGSYGPTGVYTAWWGYAELDKIQEYLNTQEYKDRVKAGEIIHPADSFLTLWQVGTVGDGSADDGNIFGYDIIEANSNIIYVACQTSGDVSKTNTGASGVYDILGIEFNQSTGKISFYQAGDELDEEIYACTELANGKIAFCGRTAGVIGGTNYGGYDILLGIYDPADDSIVFYQYGSGLNDRAFNVHDVGNNTVALSYVTSGSLGGQTHVGADDVGVVFFNYSTETWGNAYQVGTTGSDFLDTQGKPSVLMGDGRIAIALSTAGNFNPEDPNNQNYGFLDLGLAIFDPSTETWQRTQIGSQSSEIATSISARGETLMLTGYIEGTFEGESEGIFVECDTGFSFKGITST